MQKQVQTGRQQPADEPQDPEDYEPFEEDEMLEALWQQGAELANDELMRKEDY